MQPAKTWYCFLCCTLFIVVLLSLCCCCRQIDVDVFVCAGVPCLRPEYIAAYLMDDPGPQLSRFSVSDSSRSSRTNQPA